MAVTNSSIAWVVVSSISLSQVSNVIFISNFPGERRSLQFSLANDATMYPVIVQYTVVTEFKLFQIREGGGGEGGHDFLWLEDAVPALSVFLWLSSFNFINFL